MPRADPGNSWIWRPFQNTNSSCGSWFDSRFVNSRPAVCGNNRLHEGEMSFLDKFKNLGKADGDAAVSVQAGQGEAGYAQPSYGSVGDDPTQKLEHPSSIISEAMPTEMAGQEFTDTTTNFGASTVAAESQLTPPLPTPAPQGRNQLLLTILVALGLIGTAGTVALTIVGRSPHAAQPPATPAAPGRIGPAGTVALTSVGGSRSAAQVRATGQALMQSQRLAKSVSAALVGNPTAFAELRESVTTLSSVVDTLRPGEGPLAAAPGSVQPSLEAVTPLVQ